MQHQVSKVKFSRNTNQRKALLRSLLRELILRGRIETTIDKAKWLKKEIDKTVTRAKREGLQGLKLAYRDLNDKEATLALKSLLPKLQSRNSGYTRIYRLGPREGDNTTIAKIELILDEEKKEEKETEKPKAKKPRSKTKKVE